VGRIGDFNPAVREAGPARSRPAARIVEEVLE